MVIKKVLIDLSGTLHIENNAIPGAVEALRKLRQSNVELKFVTNTSKECRKLLYERLIKLGFKLDLNEIFSSLSAASHLIVSRNLNPLLLVDKNALDDFPIVDKNTTLDSVVIGLAPENFNYSTLNEAFRLLKSGAQLIAINKGRYHKTDTGLSLGPGLIVEGLEYAADCKAVLVGKPSKDFFLSALGETSPSEAVMIGDDARDDIGGAQSSGIRGILVKTGKYRNRDETLISPTPMATVDSFPEAVDLIIKLNSN